MKTEEMADLLEGFASMTEKHMSKQALKDMRIFSSCLRGFSGETVASFCKSIAKAKESKPDERRSTSAIDHAKVDSMVIRINRFLDNPVAYEFPQIEQLAQDFIKDLKMAEIKAVGERLEGPVSPKTKPAMLTAWIRWLESIKLGSDQGTLHLSGAGTTG